MKVSELKAHLDEVFDDQLTYHGYTTYMRDYELVIYQSVDPNPAYGLVPRYLRYLFRICPEVDVRSSVLPSVWARSLDDQLLDVRTVTRDAAGYVWGVECQMLYPGATIIEDSERTHFWRDELGVDFHEVLIEANAQSLRLVFSELIVEEVADGYTPYQLTIHSDAERYADGSKIPLSPTDM